MLLLIVSHYLLHFYHVPDTVTSLFYAYAFQFSQKPCECYYYCLLYTRQETEAPGGYVTQLVTDEPVFKSRRSGERQWWGVLEGVAKGVSPVPG